MIDPRIEKILLNSRLEGWKIEGCAVPVLDLKFYSLRLVYTVLPKSNKATPVHTAVRLPLDEKVLKATTKWLDLHCNRIVTKSAKKGKPCRKSRPVQKARK
jgi:hypothetical protein